MGALRGPKKKVLGPLGPSWENSRLIFQGQDRGKPRWHSKNDPTPSETVFLIWAIQEASKSLLDRPRGEKKLWCRPRASWENLRLIFQPQEGPKRPPPGPQEAPKRLILGLLGEDWWQKLIFSKIVVFSCENDDF